MQYLEPPTAKVTQFLMEIGMLFQSVTGANRGLQAMVLDLLPILIPILSMIVVQVEIANT